MCKNIQNKQKTHMDKKYINIRNSIILDTMLIATIKVFIRPVLYVLVD